MRTEVIEEKFSMILRVLSRVPGWHKSVNVMVEHHGMRLALYSPIRYIPDFPEYKYRFMSVLEQPLNFPSLRRNRYTFLTRVSTPFGAPILGHSFLSVCRFSLVNHNIVPSKMCFCGYDRKWFVSGSLIYIRGLHSRSRMESLTDQTFLSRIIKSNRSQLYKDDCYNTGII